MTIGRFAPSPSGRMHLGNLFTALLAWLSVRAKGGKMLLRIEDLDPDRSKQEYIDALRDDLSWLGLWWDEEMPLQSTRSERYAEAFDRLPTYPCYCSRSELHVASAPHMSDGKLIYAGTCRDLSEEERKTKTRNPAWRVRVPDRTITFTDGVFGLQRENLAEECGDFIVRRSDGVYAYQLAVVCDDADGGLTEVVRGCDLMDSTPRQIWLYETLGLPVPQFYHVPLLVAPDGKRLSKREKSLDMSHLRGRFQPETLIGYLACLAGLIAKPVPVKAAELIEVFSWNKIGKEPITVKTLL
ncbi:MAG: tRNA glutamyl-Q(34) synthetase GluQRS [Clostridia bacterium]|nr:tRNA glutamyl-Q(34) synthetase GluQRS [Oscillospiraceae bacterium]MBQ3763257.1 tRNA glutamyl-Q(34) synthetase GluQRS [Clostridia bacterium]